MNTLIKTSTAIALLMGGCHFISAQSITGNGNVITKSVNTAAYNKINVSGSMSVVLESGAEGTISVTAEENVQDYIVVESDGETLTIGFKSNTSLYNVKEIRINVPFKDLSQVTLTGSGEITSHDKIKGADFSTYQRGSGEISIPVEVAKLHVELNGSGSMTVSGKADDLEISLTGSGELLGRELTSNNINANIFGSGEISVNANTTLKGKIQGSGSINYGGNPDANQVKIFGSGSVNRI